MIIVTGSMTATPETIDELLAASLEHVRRSREEPGCISHAAHRDVKNPLRLMLLERWESAEVVRAHFAVPASARFVTTATALAASPPHLELFSATPVSVS